MRTVAEIENTKCVKVLNWEGPIRNIEPSKFHLVMLVISSGTLPCLSLYALKLMDSVSDLEIGPSFLR